MNEKILISLFLLAFLFATPIFAQKQQKKSIKENVAKVEKISRPNFSGDWELDYSRSRFDKLTKAFHTKFENFSRTLFIEQNVLTLKTIEKNSWNWIDKNTKAPSSAEATNVYFMNNRGEINTVGTEQFRTKTKWVGNKLVITHFTSGEYVEIEPYATSQVNLSEDKNTLIWHFKFIVDNKKEEEESKEMETYLVFTRKKG